MTYETESKVGTRASDDHNASIQTGLKMQRGTTKYVKIDLQKPDKE